MLENLLGFFEAFESLFLFVEGAGMDAAARAVVLDGMLQVQHFVIQDILDGQAADIGRVEQTAEDDGVVR